MVTSAEEEVQDQVGPAAVPVDVEVQVVGDVELLTGSVLYDSGKLSHARYSIYRYIARDRSPLPPREMQPLIEEALAQDRRQTPRRPSREARAPHSR